MKRILYILILAVSLLPATACAGVAPTDVNAAGEGESGTANQEASEATKILYGEITEVVGNALTIKEIQIPQREGMDFSGMTEFTLPNGTVIPVDEEGNLDFSDVELPEGFSLEGGGMRMAFGEDGEMRNFGGEGGEIRTFSGEGGEMRMPGGEGEAAASGEGFAAPDGEGGARRFGGGEGTVEGGRLARNYTGEEIEVFIPVGIPIMTTVRGDEGIEEKELALGNVKSGDTITITYKEDGTTIDTVRVQQSGSVGGFGGDSFMPGAQTFFIERVGP